MPANQSATNIIDLQAKRPMASYPAYAAAGELADAFQDMIDDMIATSTAPPEFAAFLSRDTDLYAVQVGVNFENPNGTCVGSDGAAVGRLKLDDGNRDGSNALAAQLVAFFDDPDALKKATEMIKRDIPMAYDAADALACQFANYFAELCEGAMPPATSKYLSGLTGDYQVAISVTIATPHCVVAGASAQLTVVECGDGDPDKRAPVRPTDTTLH